MKLSYIFTSLLLLPVLYGCNESKQTGELNQEAQPAAEIQIQYAKGFSVEYHENYKLLTLDPSIFPGDTNVQYVLKHRGVELDQQFPEAQVIETPLRTIACQSTTHLPLLDALGLNDRLTGFAWTEYIRNPEIKSLVEAGKVMEISQENGIDPEKVAALNPDALMVFPYEDGSYAKFSGAGTQVLMNAEYLEAHPLGKAEWIKFMGFFFEREQEADSIFKKIEGNYLDLKQLTIELEKPIVIAGQAKGKSWNAPGGKSFQTQFLLDAGAQYLWQNKGETEGVKLEVETAMEQAVAADYWTVVIYDEEPFTKEKLLARNEEYRQLKALENSRVVYCNTKESPFFEDAVIQPDLILADLINAFHPGLLPGHEPKYYKLIAD